MLRVATLLTLMLLGLLGSLRFVDNVWDDVEEILEVQMFESATAERFATYRCFKEGLDATVSELADGEVTLLEGQTRVRALALQYYPGYLQDINVSESRHPAELRIAHNLVGHVENRFENRPDIGHRLTALEEELKNLHGEMTVEAVE